MAGTLSLCMVVAALAMGQVRVLPIEPDTRVFAADATGNDVADICLLTGHTLTIHPGVPTAAEPLVIQFPEGTSAFDMADLDGDGVPELIAIQGSAVMRQALRPGRQPAAMFERPNRLAYTAPEPYPYVLVVEKEAGALIALPGLDTFDLLTAAGETIESFPIGEDAPQRVEIGQPFRSWTTTQPQVGPPGSLEGYASHIVAFEPDLPVDLVPIAREGQLYEGPRAPRPEAGGDGRSWPAIRIGQLDGHEIRARYALSAGERAETLIRVERLAVEEGGRVQRGGGRLGPERRYPGTLLVSETAPDFDGDGFADLLLWDAPLPGRSLGALTAAATAATWPVRVRMHAFDPAAGRFVARAHAAISFGIPVEWFLFARDGGPLRLHVTADFDNDGQADFGCATGPREYTMWHSSTGYRGVAARVITTEAPLERIEFVHALGEGRAATLALRTGSALHVIDPR